MDKPGGEVGAESHGRLDVFPSQSRVVLEDFFK
jgi:hypothetical protein